MHELKISEEQKEMIIIKMPLIFSNILNIVIIEKSLLRRK